MLRWLAPVGIGFLLLLAIAVWPRSTAAPPSYLLEAASEQATTTALALASQHDIASQPLRYAADSLPVAAGWALLIISVAYSVQQVLRLAARNRLLLLEMQIHGAIAHEQARQSALPPHIVHYHGGGSTRRLDTPTVEARVNPPTAPPLAQLLASGWQPTLERMTLGYAASGPLYGNINALLSTAVVGRPGQGKTTLLRFVLAQLLLAGGEALLLDPHGDIVGELGGLVRIAASSSTELNDAAAWLNSEYDRRLADYRHGQRTFTPLLVLADELPILPLKSAAAMTVITRTVLEMRKCSGYTFISGQGLPADRFGGSLARDALSSRYIFASNPRQARAAGLDSETARLVEALTPGRAILDGPTPTPTIVAIPLSTSADLKQLALPRPLAETDETDETAKVRRVFASGGTYKDAVAAVSPDARPGSGALYLDACRRVNTAMQELAQS
jgi:hypothetical protein